MLMMNRLRDKGTDRIETNMSTLELLERLIKCKAIIEDTTERKIIEGVDPKVERPKKVKIIIKRKSINV